MRLLLALLFGTTLLLAAPVPKDKKKTDDAEAILGSWAGETFDDAGAFKGPSKEQFQKLRYVFKKDTEFKMLTGREDEFQGSFKMNKTTDPKSIDIELKNPVEQKFLGLYELDGESLKICYTIRAEKKRPKELKAIQGETYVMTFKRVVEEKKEEKKDK